jgi:hypothetical protein
MNRIYHHYKKWEDFKHGFYDSCSNENQLISIVIGMFSDEMLTRIFMNRVVDEWTYSCQHNLTNENLNKIAYIGQAACCLYANIPNTITRKTWSKLSEKIQNRSNKIAQETLNKWLNAQI